MQIRPYEVIFPDRVERVLARNHSQARYRATKHYAKDTGQERNTMYLVWCGKTIKSCKLLNRISG